MFNLFIVFFLAYLFLWNECMRKLFSTITIPKKMYWACFLWTFNWLGLSKINLLLQNERDKFNDYHGMRAGNICTP